MLAALAFVLLLGAASPAHAHDPGLSALTIELKGGRVVVHLVVARREIDPLVVMDTDRDGVVTQGELAAARPRLQALGGTAIALESDSAGRTIPAVAVDLDDSDALHFRLTLPLPASGQVGVRIPLIARLAPGHRQYVQVRDDRGGLVSEHIVQADSAGFVVSLREATPGPRGSFRAFFTLGVEHIAAGYDHLLFLLALLIVGPGWRRAASIITSFTVAHSITLALATWGVVPATPALVEPLIAASIVYVGVENLGGRPLAPRWTLTFVFGLVHGLGFAAALRDLGVGGGGDGILVPLLAFNLGVETGQLTLAALALPLIWRLQRRPRVFARVATACSAVVTLAGAAWLIQRTVLA